jgi:hypothetical protein
VKNGKQGRVAIYGITMVHLYGQRLEKYKAINMKKMIPILLIAISV